VHQQAETGLPAIRDEPRLRTPESGALSPIPFPPAKKRDKLHAAVRRIGETDAVLPCACGAVPSADAVVLVRWTMLHAADIFLRKAGAAPTFDAIPARGLAQAAQGGLRVPERP
jgi:hypothetical protein